MEHRVIILLSLFEWKPLINYFHKIKSMAMTVPLSGLFVGLHWLRQRHADMDVADVEKNRSILPRRVKAINIKPFEETIIKKDEEAPRGRYTDGMHHNVVALAPRATIAASALNRLMDRSPNVAGAWMHKSDHYWVRNGKESKVLWSGGRKQLCLTLMGPITMCITFSLDNEKRPRISAGALFLIGV